jgi:Zn-finger nucleic acid-binding protein
MKGGTTMRILAACKNCNAQYDVSGQKPHDVLHCRCGGMIEVPEPRVTDARLVRCASCGASRGSGGQNCEFCGARFSLVDKGWGTICPGCFCRLPNDAQFCVECGIGIHPQKLDAIRTDLSCPRCKVPLQTRIVSKAGLFECADCAGLWLPVGVFENICSNSETMSAATRLFGPGKNKHFELAATEEVKYMPCPGCKNLMNRRNFGRVSGVIIDTCRNCGVWLDNQELNRIVQFIQAGGIDKMRDLEARERDHSEKMKMDFPGMSSVNAGNVISSRGSWFDSAQGSNAAPTVVRIIAEIARAFFR